MKTSLTAGLRAMVPALAAAVAAALVGTARAESPPTCRAEVDRLAQTLLARKLPQLCAPCAARLATTLESMYGQGRLPPSLYVSAGAAEWDDPQTRPVMFSGKSLAGVADGDRLAADIDSGYGPRGALRLIYTRANEPIAIATADKQTFIPLAYCVAAPR
ncbi:NYN domain-containing protein [Trinickia diaoshuihuensis]|jgi:hypothetical protein|uniref:NYN domain-containing protein n=1 Tax=Trinickia diaoshuihuensis TaxID=2292265 RepID=UPI0013C2BB41|nr:NYN domain-containing protein [Trinickia diaoshuihuensis]